MPDGLVAAAAAAAFSGIPSTLWTLWRGGDLLASTAAAGTLVVAPSAPRHRQLVAGALAHVVISGWWGLVLARLLPTRRTALVGAGAGLAIAALDLGVIGRRFPAIAALSPGPQVADHTMFGAVVGAVLSRRRRRHDGTRPDWRA